MVYSYHCHAFKLHVYWFSSRSVENDTMNTATNITIKAIFSALLLLGTAACANVQGAPSMADYSYVPPSKIGAPAPLPSLEDF